MQKVALALSCLACVAHARSAGKGEEPLQTFASLLRANSLNPYSNGPSRSPVESDGSRRDVFDWATESGRITPRGSGSDVDRHEHQRYKAAVQPGRGNDVFNWANQGGGVPHDRRGLQEVVRPGGDVFDWATERGAVPRDQRSKAARQNGGDVFDWATMTGQIPRGGASDVAPQLADDSYNSFDWAQGSQATRQHREGAISHSVITDVPHDMSYADMQRNEQYDPMEYREPMEYRSRKQREHGNGVPAAVGGLALAAAASAFLLYDSDLLAEVSDKISDLVEVLSEKIS